MTASASEREDNQECQEPAVIPSRSITPSQIDADALKVVRRLQRFGHLAYLVGGCVRDLLLKRSPKDFDVATSAKPNEIRKVFRNCRLIGRRFRLAHIHFQGKIIETATFRAELQQNPEGDLLIRSDNEFGDERADAFRRDFTINALFYDPVAKQLIDYTDGLEDLVERKLRFIGQPSIRVQEDPVRILRAIKFAARLGFRMEEETWRAICDYREELKKAAPPRLLEEIQRMLRSGAAEASFRLLWHSGVIEVLLPEVAHYLARSLERGEEREPGVGLWAYLRALDKLGDRDMLTNSVLLAGLVLHPVLDAAACAGEGYGLRFETKALGEVARAMVRPWVERIRLPKWESERIQQILAGQKRLARLRTNASIPKSLLRRNDFPEILDLFELYVRATGKDRRKLAHLRKTLMRSSNRCPNLKGALGDGQAASERKKRPPRRRHGGRRRKPAFQPSAPTGKG